ncbi:MAG: DegT/DnrJ/EryC1/StrS family aminotransferase [Desulfovibrio sp.]|nr:DegT/DnrJ/EryC1/StrS family aminotransferase [Desulfovibrio sp.]
MDHDLKINFSGRAIKYTDDEIAAVVAAMRDAEPLTQGRHLAEFERKFAEYQGVEPGSCLAVMNGCAALEMSAQLCDFRPGDEVIIPSHTFTASAYPFIKHGAKPVWADIDPKTRVVTAETIARVITPKTRAVAPVHLYGYVADMPAIMELCERHNLICVEDAAQSIGSDIDGQKAGSFGDMAIFSFHSHKNLTTLGEGGMLYVRDPDLRELAPLLRHNGHCAFTGDRPNYWTPAMGNVDLPMRNGRPLMPSNYSIGEVECALGAKLLDRIDQINAEKRTRALALIDSLADFPELEFHRVANSRHNYHLLAARMSGGTAQRDRFMTKMYEQRGIKCVVQYLPLNRYDFYQKLGYGGADCPQADLFFDSMVSFPFQHWLTEADCNYLRDSIRATLTEMRQENA